MKKNLILAFIFVFCVSVIFSQTMDSLPANLHALNPENIFPLAADKDFTFKDGNKTTPSNTFTAVKKPNGQVLFTAEVQTPTTSHYGVEAAFKSTKPVKR